MTVLVRNEQDRALAVACVSCSRFTTDTETGRCAGCRPSALDQHIADLLMAQRLGDEAARALCYRQKGSR